MAEGYGIIDYARLRDAVRDALSQFFVSPSGQARLLLSVSNQSVGPGAEYVSDSVDVSTYRLKTVSVVCDYGMEVTIEVSDDGTNWYAYYGPVTLTANQLHTFSFEEDYLHLRVRVRNPDTAAAHTILMLTVKGR